MIEAQSEIQGEILADAPVVLDESGEVIRRVRSIRVQVELALSRQSHQERREILPDDGCRRAVAGLANPRVSERVGSRRTPRDVRIQTVLTHIAAELQGMLPHHLHHVAKELIRLRRILRRRIIAQALETGLAAATSELDQRHHRELGGARNVRRIAELSRIEALARFEMQFIHAREVEADIQNRRRIDRVHVIERGAPVLARQVGSRRDVVEEVAFRLGPVVVTEIEEQAVAIGDVVIQATELVVVSIGREKIAHVVLKAVGAERSRVRLGIILQIGHRHRIQKVLGNDIVGVERLPRHGGSVQHRGVRVVERVVQRGEIAFALGVGGDGGIVRGRIPQRAVVGLRIRQVFPGEKPEQPVASVDHLRDHHGTARGQPVLVEVRHRDGGARAVGEEIHSIQPRRLREFVHRSVKRVGSGFQDLVRGAAAGVAVGSIVVECLHADFLDGILRRTVGQAVVPGRVGRAIHQ